ncbi:LiaF domain-containing protein [Halomicrobium sp. LC1Hm]|uniref:LiaF transmembrane domain-containing protein n=1 Tax=Halomicrobium sp. LC1Hm TaxID=2610902 RepID=UPI001298505A|nr:LiaF domain-containing protein [Halomicrobium sp. LC1Hm]
MKQNLPAKGSGPAGNQLAVIKTALLKPSIGDTYFINPNEIGTMPRNLVGRLTTGTVIVLIGLVLLLSTTGLVEMRSVWGWIAALFVLIGVWALIRSEFRNLVGPAMVIAIAGTFFLRNVGVVPDGAIGTWWPLFVVLFGVLVMINRSRRRQRIALEGHRAADELIAIAIFGTDERRVSTDQFTGAELVSVFGDAVIDLRESSVRTRPAIIETVSVFGDAEVRVPDAWDVRIETLNVFGDTTDRRPQGPANRAKKDEPELIVTGIAMFGDIQIRD